MLALSAVLFPRHRVFLDRFAFDCSSFVRVMFMYTLVLRMCKFY